MDLMSDTSSSSSENEEQAFPTSRKQQRRPEKWLRRENKQKRDRGEEYTSQSTKKMVKVRKVGAPCTKSCPDLCFNKVGMDNVQVILKAYWDLANYDAQKKLKKQNNAN